MERSQARMALALCRKLEGSPISQERWVGPGHDYVTQRSWDFILKVVMSH